LTRHAENRFRRVYPPEGKKERVIDDEAGKKGKVAPARTDRKKRERLVLKNNTSERGVPSNPISCKFSRRKRKRKGGGEAIVLPPGIFEVAVSSIL